MAESKKDEPIIKTRTLHFSVDGPFMNKLALEQCHENGKIGYAIELLMGVTQRENQTHAENLETAIDILNGKRKIVGIYPGDSYDVVPAGPNDAKYDIKATMEKFYNQLQDAKAEIGLLNQKLACIAEYLDDNAMLRAINRYWQDELGEEGFIFFDNSPPELQCSYREYTGMAFDRLLENRQPFTATAIKPESMLSDFIEHMQIARDDDYGWLSPNGKFHPADWGAHNEYAYQYCQEHKPYDWGDDKHADSFMDAGDFLSKHGWVLLHNPAQGTALVTEPLNGRFTKAQREFLYGYYIDRERADLAEKYIRED